DFLACGIGSLINILGPVRTVIGGGVFHSGDVLLPKLLEKLPSYTFPSFLKELDVRVSSLVDSAALLGVPCLFGSIR
ncbi:MAG: ROK family protein, partial [Candidatus Wallbacteria bacterium]|nr:ROK family protein [Candidatus Wallbacteria bacterium]